eukprot:3309718-Pyramimonas_sp.AAC.1
MGRKSKRQGGEEQKNHSNASKEIAFPAGIPGTFSRGRESATITWVMSCLLYTSDAADDTPC